MSLEQQYQQVISAGEIILPDGTAVSVDVVGHEPVNETQSARPA